MGEGCWCWEASPGVSSVQSIHVGHALLQVACHCGQASLGTLPALIVLKVAVSPGANPTEMESSTVPVSEPQQLQAGIGGGVGGC